MNTPAQVPSSVEAVAAPTTESDSARVKEITKHLVEDVRPLVERLSAVPDATRPLLERARPWADVFLPIVDEMRPRIDDLRPVMRDLNALLDERLPILGAAATRFIERLVSIRPTLPSAGLALSMPAIPTPHLMSRGGVRSIRPPIAAAVGSLARRLRPGRWAFRTTAVGLIALVLSNVPLRDAMVDEVNWTRSALQTIEIPAIQIPNIELPTIEMPTFEIPAFELPKIEIPAITFPNQKSAASPKLAPAQFDLPPLNAYRAAFETQASYPTVAPNAAVEWVVALRNTGSAGWYRGVAGAQASLALTDGTEAAVQTTAYVAPGQVGWFIVRFRAPIGTGAHAVALFPRIDGRGELPNLGIYTLVTVR